jgi:hypothetical protein
MSILKNMDDFITAFKEHNNFTYSKINHAYWEIVATVEKNHPELNQKSFGAEEIIPKFRSYFAEGFIAELHELLFKLKGNPAQGLFMCYGLNAWTDDDVIFGLPAEYESSYAVMKRFAHDDFLKNNGLLLKEAIHDGSLNQFIDLLKDYRVVLTGPAHLNTFFKFIGHHGEHHFIEIDALRASEDRFAIEHQIKRTSIQTLILKQLFSFRPVRWLHTGFCATGMIILQFAG